MKRLAACALLLASGFVLGIAWQRHSWRAWFQDEAAKEARRVIAETVRLQPCQDPIVYLAERRH